MANSKSLDFLPEYLRTSYNKRFLSSTLDQLISEPRTKKFNGYVGRQFAPVYRANDEYIQELNQERQNYQLEPSIVVTNKNQEIDFYSSYSDILQQIKFHGGQTNKHSRLFSNQDYSYNGHFDLDKLVNYNRYYWMPNGPDPVSVGFGYVPVEGEFVFNYSSTKNNYQINDITRTDPEIVLRRGGSYTFAVDQTGQNFWIQTAPGITGTDISSPNVSTRLGTGNGIVNNGTDSGTITFNVPASNAQQYYQNMPLAGTVNLVTSVKYSQIANQPLTTFINTYGYIDNYRSSLENKFIIFIDQAGTNSTDWTSTTITGYPGTTIAESNRASIFRINIVDISGTDYIVLTLTTTVAIDNKVFISEGQNFAGKQYYRSGNLFVDYPLITADLDFLYYQNSADSDAYGKIRIIDENLSVIDIENEILGQTDYTSPNEITFTNGMKVSFDSYVSPSSYANNTYWVEGVGKEIKLILEQDLYSLWQESTAYQVGDFFVYSGNLYQVLNDFTSSAEFEEPGIGVGTNYELVDNIDYITINRASRDNNDWSKANRWVHESVILKSAEYNNTAPLLNQLVRGKRPIIEFEADLQLFNFGREFVQEVDFYDDTFVDAFGGTPITETEYKYSFAGTSDGNYNDGEFIVGRTFEITVLGTTTDWNAIAGTIGISYQVGDKFTAANEGDISGDGTADLLMEFQGITLASGQTVVFGGDFDPETKRIIYEISIITLDGNDTIILTPVVLLEDFQNIKITNGTNVGKNFHLENLLWAESQLKESINQKPLFDLVDDTLDSLKTLSLSDFAGNFMFAYKIGAGNNDTVLGFPLSYKNIGNLGDIEFYNHYEQDTFNLAENNLSVSRPVSTGFMVKNITRTVREKLNVWESVVEKSRQYQEFITEVNVSTDQFVYDLIPVDADPVIATIKVYVDNQLINNTEYTVIVGTETTTIQFNNSVSAGSRLVVLIYSDNNNTDAFYQVPSNLENNPLNQKFDTLTLGQIRSHAREIFSTMQNLEGSELGSNNSRDLNYKNISGTILQHSAPTIYGGLFLTHNRANFVNSIYYAQKEYSRFKNRFLEQAKKIEYSSTADQSQYIDSIIKTINISKNTDSPWYYSDMLPYGDDKTVFTYEILDVDLDNYQIETIFNDQVASGRAVLVYLNNELLLKGRDYSFPQEIPAVRLNESLVRQLGDIVKIVDYISTDGGYIPETPTKLGIYPKFEPMIFVDSRYSESVSVIQGHDGSITPCFGDFRDQLLLELEKRIYNNIKTEYVHDLMWVLPGKFRTTDYTKSEFDQILYKAFLKWIGNYQLDYISNNTFDSNNSRTWNYKKSVSVLDNEPIPGHWRGIYRYFYDTDRPHLTPWEMLGFSEQPLWWEDQYGAAPYTSGNTNLWQDLEAGRIQQGVRAGIDLNFARPGLSRVIPVDEYGDLKTPDQFLIKNYSSSSVSSPWAIGDSGPVESAWRNSSDYPYAMQLALALAKPAEYFGLLIDNQRYRYDSTLNQILFVDSKDRINPSQIVVNGSDIQGTVYRNSSWLNWVVNYCTSQGLNGYTTVRELIDNLGVRLSYKLAGFSDKKLLKVYAEQASPGSTNDSVLIPEENYQLYLHKSTPIRRAVYSSVIIRRTGTGYSVEGYDYNNPYFTIVPSRSTGSFTTVKGIEKTAKIYKEFQSVYLTIPYGYEFQNRQQIVDFLVSYERYLNSQGFRFTEFNDDLKKPQDWKLSAQEFLVWSEQGWGESSILVLSPGMGKLSVYDLESTVDEINGQWTGSRLLNQNFTAIKNSEFNVLRERDQFEIETIDNKIIGLADLSFVQYEHVIVLDNLTVFNDVIYDPSLGNRQYRLKLIGLKTASWSGRLDSPGFFYTNGKIPEWRIDQDYLKNDLVAYKNRIYSANEFISGSSTFDFSKWSLNTQASTDPALFLNFSANARKFVNIYDVDADYYDADLEEYSSGLIGFRNRNYLDAIGVETKSQIKFYQGFLKEKGTKNAVQALTSATFNKLGGNLNYDEEWAVRVGFYGAVDNQEIVEFVLDETVNKSNPFGVELLTAGETASGKPFKSYTENQLYSKDLNFDGTLFNYRDNNYSEVETDIATAGFVSENDVNLKIFDLTDAIAQTPELVQNIGIGYIIWTAKDFASQWNIYRTSGTDLLISTVSYGLDNTAELRFENYHSLSAGDIIVVKDFDPVLDGIYQILSNESLYSVIASVDNTKTQYLEAAGGVESSGIVFKLESIKFSRLTDIANRTNWINGDRVWIDYPDQWAVYRKQNPWSWGFQYQSAENDIEWARNINISNDKLRIVVGIPKSVNPTVEYINIGNRNSPYTQILLSPKSANDQFGFSTFQSGQKLFIGAPGYSTDRGYVAVYNLVGQSYFLDQLILGTALSTDKFGSSVAASEDLRWLFASAPTGNLVKTFKRVDIDLQTLLLTPAKFTAGIAATTMTVTNISTGTILDNKEITGSSVVPGTLVLLQLTGTNAAAATIAGGGNIATNTLTMANVIGVELGQIVAGTNIPVNTFVTNIVGNTITLSNNLSSTAADNYVFRQAGKEGTYTVDTSQTVSAGTTITVVEDTYDLSWNNYPVDSESIRVVNGITGILFEEGTDYVINSNAPGSNNELVLTTATIENFIVYKSNYYKFVNSISEPGSSNFGHEVKSSTDGRQLLISAIGENTNSGAVYLFDRSIEAFDSNSGDTDFTAQRSLSYSSGVPLYDVSVNSVYQIYGIDFVNPAGNDIEFSETLSFKDRVEIETNEWNLIKKFESQLPQTQSKFGYSVDFCPTNCSVYIGQPYYRTSSYNAGLVERHINTSRASGIIIGTVTNPTVTVGHSIRINDYEIIFSGTTLTSVIDDINSAAISGVTASNRAGKLLITIDGQITNNVLRVLPGLNTGLTDLGLEIFDFGQTIYKPNNENQNFGSKVKISNNARKLIVTGDGANSFQTTTWDSVITTFDSVSTNFNDIVTDSGSVYAYELLSDPDGENVFVYVQDLEPDAVDSGDNFGKSIWATDDIIVSASKNNTESGTIDIFDNTLLDAWKLDKSQLGTVDLNSISRLMLYNSRTNEIVTYLDYIDPARSKVLGIADQNIDYKTSFDPAVYNVENSVAGDNDYFWKDMHVGRVWWDLESIRFIDYQQQDRQFRLRNWGQLFTGSQIKVYEWVESPVKPSQYQSRGLSGTPKFVDDSFYTESTIVDIETGLLKTKYYFWVENKITEIPKRNISIAAIKNIIEHPENQDVPYAVILDNNSLGLYNCSRYLSGSELILKIVVNNQARELPVHTEWQLIKESNNENIPEFIINKIIDSLVGSTRVGNTLKPVPDPSLSVNQRYGINLRPRQTMFVDRLNAAKIFINYLNAGMAKEIVAANRDLSVLLQSETPANSGETWDLTFDTYEDFLTVDLSALANGTKVLVSSHSEYNNDWVIYTILNATISSIRVQSYNLDNYWNYRNWYDDTYDQKTIPDYVVSDFSAVPFTEISTGEIVKVNNIGNGLWGIYRKTDTGYQPLALQDSTIELNDLIYNPQAAGIGFDITNFDSNAYDYNPGNEFRLLINALKDNILIDEYKPIFIGSIFSLFEYVFYEQKQPDWLFKTSFISVKHNLRQLDQYPSYVRDDQDYYRSYIEEVKPYKTKIREYLLTFDGSDPAELDLTDFDFPVYFNETNNRYEFPDPLFDDDIMALAPYAFWNNNYSYEIESVDIINPGDFYYAEPTLVVNGGDGTAKLRAIVNNGQIIRVDVLNGGNGFLTVPTISIIPPDEGVFGKVIARLENKRVRTFDTKIKFDRTEYNEIENWQSSTTYKKDKFFVYNNQAYLILTDFTSGVSFNSATTTTLATAVSTTLDSAVTAGLSLVNATNFASAGYVKINNEIFSYTGKSSNTLTGVTRAVFNSTREIHLVGATVERINYRVALVGDLNSAMQRAQLYYAPTSEMTPNDIRRLFSGVDYPGVRVQGTGDFYGPQITNYDVEYEGQSQVSPTAIATGSISGYELTITDIQRGQLEDGQYLTGDNIVSGTRIITTSIEGSITGTTLTVSRVIRGIVRIGQILNHPNLIDSIAISSFGTGTGGIGTYTLSNSALLNGTEISLYGNGIGGEGTYTVNISQTVPTTTIQAKLPDITDIDVFYKSTFLDTSLGTRADDINVHGGAFVDTANSHAPEELVPGRIYDTLEMRVFTITNGTGGVGIGNYLGFRIFHSMNCNTTDSNRNPEPTVQLKNNMASGDTSAELILHDPYAILNPAVGFSPTIVINGEYMTYTTYNSFTKTISGITRGANPKDHVVGSFVTVFDNLKNERHYYRISDESTSTLARALNYNDIEIKLVDSSNFIEPYAPDNIPGVVFINGEKIIYWTINYVTHTLGQLVRGVHGTGIPLVHQIGSHVSDASENQIIEDGDPKTWLTLGVGTPADGLGLEIANSGPANFLRSKVSYAP